MAREQDLDLVEVAALANPPVCRIMNFSKWQYDEKQKAKESRKKSSSSAIKEMKYRPKIGSGDFDTKTRKIAEFLGEGHKVKVTIMFRGREMQHPELGMKILQHVAEEVSTVGKIEAQAKQDGRNMIMVLAPDRKKAPPKPHISRHHADNPNPDSPNTDSPNTDSLNPDSPMAEPVEPLAATPIAPVEAPTDPAPEV